MHLNCLRCDCCPLNYECSNDLLIIPCFYIVSYIMNQLIISGRPLCTLRLNDVFLISGSTELLLR